MKSYLVVTGNSCSCHADPDAAKRAAPVILAAFLLLLLGNVAPAQDDEGSVEEIVVTGSLIRRTGFEGRAPVQIVNREELQAIGAAQPIDALKMLTVNTGSELWNESDPSAGTAQFNIRGLGLSSTLTLLNGRRAGVAPLGNASGATYFDINVLPLAMIERMDVLTDGASATYGSEAVAGVVNIITRKGFDGFEVSADYERARNNSGSVSVVTGKSLDRGWITLYGAVFKRDRLHRSDFPWLVDRIGGAGELTQSRLLSSTGSPGSYRPGAEVSPGMYVGIGTDSMGQSISTLPDPDCEAAGGVLRSPTDSLCRYNFIDQTSVIQAEDRIQAFSEFGFDVSDSFTLFGELGFSNNVIRRTGGAQSYSNGNVTGDFAGQVFIPADHPFNFFVANPDDPDRLLYIGPEAWDNSIHTAVPLSASMRPLGSEVDGVRSIGDRRREFDFFRTLTGIEYEFGNTWKATANYIHVKSNLTETRANDYRARAFNQAVLDGTWNPFGTRLSDPALVSPKDSTSLAGNSQAALDSFNGIGINTTRTKQNVIDAILTGDLFSMSYGDVAAALGMQYRDLSLDDIPDPLAAAGEGRDPSRATIVTGTQDVWSAFGELLVSFNDRAEMQLALRHESYGGSTGSTTDPKISVSFGATDWLSLRGSWGTSFQAPTIRQTATATSGAFIDDPASPNPDTGALECVDRGLSNNTTFTVRGSDQLMPQSATNFNLGVIMKPSDALSVSVDYWNFEYDDLITQEEGAQAIVNNDCLDDGLPNDPRVRRDGSGQLREVFSSFINTGKVDTDGVDLAVAYTPPEFSFGRVSLEASASFVNSFDIVTNPGDAPVDGVGSRNFLNQFSSVPEWRANAGATWIRGAHSANASVRYIDGYFNDQTNEPVDSFTTLDLRYGLSLGDIFDGHDMTIAVGAANVFDADPPSIGEGVRPAYDEVVHDIRGRILYVQATYSF